MTTIAMVRAMEHDASRPAARRMRRCIHGPIDLNVQQIHIYKTAPIAGSIDSSRPKEKSSYRSKNEPCFERETIESTIDTKRERLPTGGHKVLYSLSLLLP